MTTTHEWQLPSGSEVEWAALHLPVHELTRGGMRGRLDTWKSRGASRVQDLRRVAADRGTTLQSNAKAQVTKMQSSMRTSPMKWAGIAAGTGFALGLIGRIAQARNRRRHEMPALVIVEAGC